MTSLLKRKIVHVSMISFGLLVGRTPPFGIALTCFLALLFNLFLLPRLTKKSLEKPEDLEKGFSIGIIAYPAVLLFLSIIFFSQQIYLIIGWGALAFGDAAAFYGKRFWDKAIPWNQQKTWGGALFFIVSSATLTFGFLLLLPKEVYLGLHLSIWFQVIFSASVIAAFAETIDGLVDDNIVVPIVASLSAYFFIEGNLNAAWAIPSSIYWGIAVVSLFVVLSWASKKIDFPGAIVGGGIAMLIFLGGGFEVLSLLFAFFVLGSSATMFKKKEKERSGLAEGNKGKRGVANALANASIAAICGGLAWTFPSQKSLFLAMLAASLASATADTLSSELGNAFGRKFYDILSFKKGKKGEDGIISLEGTALGALGAIVISLIFSWAVSSWHWFVYISIAGIVGNTIDSILGATLQRNGLMNNHTVNFANTLFAAIFILIIQKMLM